MTLVYATRVEANPERWLHVDRTLGTFFSSVLVATSV